jgi:hypothetical protein
MASDAPDLPPVADASDVDGDGGTVDLAGLVGWLIDRVIWAWRHSLRGIRPFTVLILAAATAGTLAWTYLVVAEGNGEVVAGIVGVLVVAAVLYAPGLLMALLWKRGVEAMAAGERLKGDVRTLIQAPKGIDEQAVLERLRQEVQGKGTWRGSRIAAKGLSKLVWEHKGAIWNGKEAAELIRPPGPFTLGIGFLGGAILLLVTPAIVLTAIGFAAT